MSWTVNDSGTLDLDKSLMGPGVADMVCGRMKNENPIPLGLKKSFGFGDRLGLASPGHIASARKFDFAPIFAQQSIRELDRTHRTPTDVMDAAKKALAASGYDVPWGADADHLKTEEDVKLTASAGFCFFTIDPSAFVVNDADLMSEEDLETTCQSLVRDEIFESDAWVDDYLGKPFDVGLDKPLEFTREVLLRAAVKYARAINHSKTMSEYIAAANADRPYEIEVSVDETDSPTSSLEHLFFGLELKRRGVKVVSLAPRFIGDMEKGIDYKGDLEAFEAALQEHVAIAKHCGPYKISVHSGSDKFSIYPVVGRVCGDLLHVKTAGTSYLEALRVVVRQDLPLFKEIASYCVGRFNTDKKSYHISTTSENIEELAKTEEAAMERAYLDEDVGRQLLHVTFGSVLTQGQDSSGRKFKEGILECLSSHDSLHEELVAKHFDKHLGLLNEG